MIETLHPDLEASMRISAMSGEPVAQKTFADGRHVHILPTLTDGLQMKVAKSVELSAEGYEEVYTYDDPPIAIAALDAWNGEGEPSGWIRHQPSDRRRTNGDPTQEYVAP